MVMDIGTARQGCSGSFSPRWPGCRAALLLAALAIGVAAGPAAGETASLNTQPGITVLLGLPSDMQASALPALARNGRIVYFQSPSAEEVIAVRKAAAAARLLGRSIFADQGEFASIHLADNLADTILVAPTAAVAEAEILRVLHPTGAAVVGGKKIVKPFPAGQDEWTHPFRAPDNNPVSRDVLARWPARTQFLGEPKFSPMPEVTVAAGGRLFKACGNHAMRANQNAVLNTLMGINAFNGCILWRRPLREGFLIHRNTMVATADVLYLADDQSCKKLDAATGKLLGEIVVPAGEADGKVWKWMALVDGVLYALVGGPERPAPTVRSDSPELGHWPWGMWPGYAYNDAKTNTGFGRTLIAFDPADGKKLWAHREQEYLDGRAVCMRGGRIYYYSPQKFLACLDARTGKRLWRNDSADLLEALGPEGPAQKWITGFSTTNYLKCDERNVYFAGPVRPHLVVASAKDGQLVWSRHDGGNVHLLLRDDAVYAVGGANGGKLDYADGKLLGALPVRRSCTRATASVDSIFYRITEGTVRIDLPTGKHQHIAPMRPPCQDGVMIAHGLLYWGPWMCGCPLSFYGNVALAPVGKDVPEGPPLVRADPKPEPTQPLQAAEGDWPCLRGDNAHSCRTTADVVRPLHLRWTLDSPSACEPTAPVIAAGLAFCADYGGIIRAVDAATGVPRWQTAAGSAVFYPPAFHQGRLLVGSADGRLYALDASTGHELWRARLGPQERWIPVFGRLMSTWPLAGGVVAQDGKVYAAAGIAHYDGTHAAAFDVATGKLLWHNGRAGHFSPVQTGVSLQGPLYIEGGQLRFRGGSAYEIAAFDLAGGRFTIQPHDQIRSVAQSAFYPYYPEYSRLATLRREMGDGRTLACYPVYDRGPSTLPAPPHLAMLAPTDPKAAPPQQRGNIRRPNRRALWQKPEWKFQAFALGKDALLAAGEEGGKFHLAAFQLGDGKELWRLPVEGRVVRDGLAIRADGTAVVSLENGRVLGFAPVAAADEK